MINIQKSAKIVGLLFILGTVSGILSLNIVSILNAPDYLIKLSENKTTLVISALSVLTMGVALSMMSVVLYPILKTYNKTLALSAVIFRGVLEMACYLGIAISWLLLLSLSQKFVFAGSPAASDFIKQGEMLQNFAFIGGNIALGIVFSIGAIIIYYVFIKTKLLPIWLALWGLVGAIIYLAYPILLIFGYKFEFLQYILAIQEMVMAVWLIVKGFNKDAAKTLIAHVS